MVGIGDHVGIALPDGLAVELVEILFFLLCQVDVLFLMLSFETEGG